MPAMEVQIFGTRKNPETRKALRFFAERRIKTHFVDLQERAAAPGELRRFAQKFGVPAMVDRASRRFADLGLGAAQLSEERWRRTPSADACWRRSWCCGRWRRSSASA